MSQLLDALGFNGFDKSLGQDAINAKNYLQNPPSDDPVKKAIAAMQQKLNAPPIPVSQTPLPTMKGGALDQMSQALMQQQGR